MRHTNHQHPEAGEKAGEVVRTRKTRKGLGAGAPRPPPLLTMDRYHRKRTARKVMGLILLLDRYPARSTRELDRGDAQETRGHPPSFQPHPTC